MKTIPTLVIVFQYIYKVFDEKYWHLSEIIFLEIENFMKEKSWCFWAKYFTILETLSQTGNFIWCFLKPNTKKTVFDLISRNFFLNIVIYQTKFGS